MSQEFPQNTHGHNHLQGHSHTPPAVLEQLYVPSRLDRVCMRLTAENNRVLPLPPFWNMTATMSCDARLDPLAFLNHIILSNITDLIPSCPQTCSPLFAPAMASALSTFLQGSRTREDPEEILCAAALDGTTSIQEDMSWGTPCCDALSCCPPCQGELGSRTVQEQGVW